MAKDQSGTYLRPLTIGGVTLAHNIVFGPMAGISDLPFRLLCAGEGAALTCTELISAKAITYKNKNTAAMLETHPDERPVAVQLFGHEPEVMREAVRMLIAEYDTSSVCCADTCIPTSPGRRAHPSRGRQAKNSGATVKTPTGEVSFDILDINMGCPVPKVVSNGEGSALMKDPGLIEKIVRACVSSRPVTVKLRSGFDARHINAVECALAAESGGAAAVTVHARTRDQMYAGKADWRIIRAVKDAVRIPVIGNGDVTDAESAKRMFEETGCDGIMISRAAQGNPWIFREVVNELKTGEKLPRPSNQEILAMIVRHMNLLVQYKGAYTAVREMRKHIAWYTAGLPGAARMRDRVNLIDDMEVMKKECEAFFQ